MNFKKSFTPCMCNDNVRYINVDATIYIVYAILYSIINPGIVKILSYSYKGKEYLFNGGIPMASLNVTFKDIEDYINGKNIIPSIKLMRPLFVTPPLDILLSFSPVITYSYKHQDFVLTVEREDGSIVKIKLFDLIIFFLVGGFNASPFYLSLYSSIIHFLLNKKTLQEIINWAVKYVRINKKNILNSKDKDDITIANYIDNVNDPDCFEEVSKFVKEIEEVIVNPFKSLLNNDSYWDLSSNFYFIGERESFYSKFNDVINLDSIEESLGKIKYGAALTIPSDLIKNFNLDDISKGETSRITDYKIFVYFFENETFVCSIYKPTN